MTQFSADDLRLLAETHEVEIETPSADGAPRRTTIWIVVDGQQVYIRSVRGPSGLWYQQLLSAGIGRLIAGEHEWPVRVQRTDDPAEIEKVSEAIRRKYEQRWAASTAAMLRPPVLPTTLGVEPA